ncbi:tyrosine-type recombinase/integrase [Methylobacterium sp. WL12]|uniref:site-specific integrase n=1 Tax=Methylobacterium sp. WL12 TaxID=2603890 RepID=UPI0011C8280C|nr:site-specific integrase [Methylobacterium sp. WL12]TXM73902.1 tyrosine-type recombinase/integrase [Methylobacterium sp. WL12]
MPLRVARPWKDPKTGVFHLRQRTPLSIVDELKGWSVCLPIGDAWFTVTVGPVVQLSLRTKEPSEARIRHSIADGALKRFWQSHKGGPRYQPEGSTQVSPQSLPCPTNGVAAEAQGRTASSPVPCPTPIVGPAVTVLDLFERWETYSADKRAANTIKRYRGSFRSFAAFAKKRDVRSLTPDDVFAWAERRRDVEGVSASAINKNDLVAVSSIFRWASGRSGGQFVPSNPVTGITLDEPRVIAQRERTFRDHEIAAILSAASAVQPDDQNPTRAASRRWCPWLAAYSGARITELTNLEKRDIRTEAGILVMDLRVTKTGEPRTVPLHAHLSELGFMSFVQAASPGPLFYDPKRHRKGSGTPPGELQSHKVAQWIRETVSLDA